MLCASLPATSVTAAHSGRVRYLFKS